MGRPQFSVFVFRLSADESTVLRAMWKGDSQELRRVDAAAVDTSVLKTRG